MGGLTRAWFDAITLQIYCNILKCSAHNPDFPLYPICPLSPEVRVRAAAKRSDFNRNTDPHLISIKSLIPSDRFKFIL